MNEVDLILQSKTIEDLEKILPECDLQKLPELLTQAIKQQKSDEFIEKLVNAGAVLYSEELFPKMTRLSSEQEKEQKDRLDKGAEGYTDSRNDVFYDVSAYNPLAKAKYADRLVLAEKFADLYLKENILTPEMGHPFYEAGEHCSKEVLKEYAANPPLDNENLMSGLVNNKYLTPKLLDTYLDHIPNDQQKKEVLFEMVYDKLPEENIIKTGDLVDLMLKHLPETRDILLAADIDNDYYGKELKRSRVEVILYWRKHDKDILKAKQKEVAEEKKYRPELQAAKNRLRTKANKNAMQKDILLVCQGDQSKVDNLSAERKEEIFVTMKEEIKNPNLRENHFVGMCKIYVSKTNTPEDKAMYFEELYKIRKSGKTNAEKREMAATFARVLQRNPELAKDEALQGLAKVDYSAVGYTPTKRGFTHNSGERQA